MQLSPIGLTLIRQFEGFVATPYRCPAGYWTVGYGHVLTPRELLAMATIAEEKAQQLLRVDVGIAERAVKRLITTALTQAQFDALVSFTYNLGAGALQRSQLRQCVNRGEHCAAPAQFRRWVWAGGLKLPGLVRRRAAEALLYQSSN